MTVFFTSDTHFGHGNILNKFQPNRRAAWNSVEEMDEGLIRNWNETVAHDDVVYHLGDFAFAQADRVYSIVQRLNGVKHFIRGNHDSVMDSQRIRECFTSFQDYAEIRPEGRFIVLSHFPFHTWNKAHHGAIHLHGHCHGSLATLGRRADVGIDSTHILGRHVHRPISLREVLAWADRQQHVAVDHHN